MDGVAAEEVVDADVADLVDDGFASEDVLKAGDGAEAECGPAGTAAAHVGGHLSGAAEGDDALHFVVRGAGEGDENFADLVFVADAREGGDGAEDGGTVETGFRFGEIIVEEADDAVTLFGHAVRFRGGRIQRHRPRR